MVVESEVFSIGFFGDCAASASFLGMLSRGWIGLNSPLSVNTCRCRLALKV